MSETVDTSACLNVADSAATDLAVVSMLKVETEGETGDLYAGSYVWSTS